MAQSSRREKDLKEGIDELNNPDLNYFLAFGISLTETNISMIEDSIRKYVSSIRGKATVVQLRLKELKYDAIEIMCNDATYDESSGKYIPNSGARKREADAAKAFKLEEAAQGVRNKAKTKNKIFKSEIATVSDKANSPISYFSDEDFFSRIEKEFNSIGIKIIDDLDDEIPFKIFEKAQKRIESFPQKYIPEDKRPAKNLYDVLSVSKTEKTDEIRMKNSALYGKRGSDKKDVQSIEGICASVKSILLEDVKTRNAYDQYLVLKDDVWIPFSEMEKWGLIQMNFSDYEKFVEVVKNLLHVSVAEAEKIVAIGCKAYKLQVLGDPVNISLDECPFCGKLYKKSDKVCSNCGNSLETLCWNCNQIIRITKEDLGCKACGATIRSHELYNRACRNLDELLSRLDTGISALQSAFLQIKNVVPNFSSKPDSTAAKKVKEYNGIIADRIKQEETVGAKYREEVKKIQQLIAKRCYQAALNAAKSLTIKYSTYKIDNSNKLISDISIIVKSAQKQVDLAKQYIAQGNVVLAITSAAKAIDICDDFTDARQIMQNYPPKAVSNLRAKVEKDNVRLEWDDIKQDFISYTIIKKIGIAPTNVGDGTLVNSGLSVRFFEDANIVSATPYYYAVYSERYGVKSSLSATMSPVTIFADIINLQQEVVEGGIKVVWETPENVKSIEVWRNTGTVASMKPGEGSKIKSSITGFYDSNCTGQNAYLIVCNYDVKGSLIQSKGILSVFKPYEKIVPLEGLKFESIDRNRFKFSCSNGYAGKVKLYYAETKLSIPFNTTLKYLNFNSICKGLAPLETVSNANGEITFSLPIGKIYQVYPIVSTEQLFVVSPPKLINTVEGIKHPSHSFSNGVVTVSGMLNPKAKAIVVCVNNEKYTELVDGNSEQITFKADEFRKANKIEIKLKANTVNYISLFVEYMEDGIVSYSPAIKLNSPIDYREAVTVLYNLQYAISATKSFKVTINFEADSAVELPKLFLMQGSPKPLNKNAGKLCDRIEDVKLKKSLFGKKYTSKVAISVNPTSTSTKFALFLNEESTYIQMKEVRKL